MYKADPEQQARVLKLSDWFQQHVKTIWDLTEYNPQSILRYPRDPADEAYQGMVRQLRQELVNDFGEETLSRDLTEYLIFPAARKLPLQYYYTYKESHQAVIAGVLIAIDWITSHPTPSVVEMIAQRCQYILEHPLRDTETNHSDSHSAEYNYAHPNLKTCIDILAALKDQPAALAFLEQFALGKWDHPETYKNGYGNTCEDTTYNIYRLYSEYDTAFAALFQAGRFDYELFSTAIQHCPSALSGYALERYEDAELETENEYDKVRRKYTRQLVWEMVEKFDDAAMPILQEIESVKPMGAKWLFAGMALIEKHEIKHLHKIDYDDHLRRILLALVRISGWNKQDDPQALVEKLRGFDQDTLLIVLPYCNKAQPLVLKALDWRELEPVRQTILSLGGGEETSDEIRYADIENSSLPDSGVLDLRETERFLGKVDKKKLKAFFTVFKKSDLEITNVLKLLMAVTGEGRKAILSALNRFGQAAIKAYGVLPLESDDEVLERYIKLKELHKDCKKFGAERQANTRAAVQVGLANLAQRAGYADATRLEWAMEAKLTQEKILLNERIPVEQWEIELVLEGIAPLIRIYKQNKLLRSIPPAVRKSNPYIQIKESQAQLKAQAARFRLSLERMMIEQEALEADDLAAVAKLPVACYLFSKTLFRNMQGDYGIFDPQNMTLSGLNNAPIPIGPAITVAHPWHLFENRTLADWQKEVIERQLVQPIKQVYRELYILTPAEKNSGDYSNRFAGHSLKAAVASRLLQSRNWKQISDDVAIVYKPIHSTGLVAYFDFPDAGHFLAENEEVVSDQIHFHGKEGKVPLETVPEIIFSEIMRDADLVVSVAQINEDDSRWSNEYYRHKTETLRSILANIGLNKVEFADHFAHVKGRLANYRVHLGSGVIHIEPGNYLCIVPDNSLKRKEKIFLPFADEDAKMSEIISKILLLHNDNKIKDESILEQIRRANGNA